MRRIETINETILIIILCVTRGPISLEGGSMNNQWSASATPVQNGSRLFDPFDVDTYKQAFQDFNALCIEDKKKYKGVEEYITQKTGIVCTPLNQNYKKLHEEIISRLSNPLAIEPLVIDTVFQRDLIINLLSSLENENYIKEIYKCKKKKVKNGLNTEEASILLDCLRQGHSLLQAGQKAELLAKPLIDFYAASAYAYAIIVVNSPLHKSIKTLKGSHGHTYNHKDGVIEFGGNIPSGTFLDLMASIPLAQIIDQNTKINYSLLPSLDFVQKNYVKIPLEALLSMIPELRDSYKRVDSQHCMTHQVKLDYENNNGKTIYNFFVGDGIDKPDREKLERSFNTSSIIEMQGSFKVSVKSSALPDIMPNIYHDAKGQLWYIESPIDGLVIPEICLHFLTISALCNIMRYSPHEWNMIISNRISSTSSLLIHEYISLFELKFPMLVVEMLTNYLPTLQ